MQKGKINREKAQNSQRKIDRKLISHELTRKRKLVKIREN